MSGVRCSASTGSSGDVWKRSSEDLGDRIEEARVNGWLGEVQELQISLEAARNKLASLDRLTRTRNRTPVPLGMPIIPGEA
ncbi:hypothetical protein AB0C13_32030 [Streptomyces sp. NPDC049099]|uniref:hypothetical protein n=1 Tax=Streptomyces sp. NPDC049099 TaxID=3155768 RepID=UPI00341B1D8D